MTESDSQLLSCYNWQCPVGDLEEECGRFLGSVLMIVMLGAVVGLVVLVLRKSPALGGRESGALVAVVMVMYAVSVLAMLMKSRET